MEEINNTINHNQSTIQPKPNLYKYLFFITFFFFFIVILRSYLIGNNQIVRKDTTNGSKISEFNSFEEHQNITSPQPTPTYIVTEQLDTNCEIKNADKYCGNISAYTKNVNGTTNLVLNKNNKEQIVNTITTGGTWYDDIKFTPSTKYLTFSVNGPGKETICIYDTQKNFFVKNDKSDCFFTQNSETPYITNNEKYLLYCSGGDYAGLDGGKVINLPDQTIKFDFIKYLGNKLTTNEVNCFYQPDSDIVTFEYHKDGESDSIFGVNYNLSTGEIKDW